MGGTCTNWVVQAHLWLKGSPKTYCSQIWGLHKSFWCWNISECTNTNTQQHLCSSMQRSRCTDQMTATCCDFFFFKSYFTFTLFAYVTKDVSKQSLCTSANAQPGKHVPVLPADEFGVCLNTERWVSICSNVGVLIFKVSIKLNRNCRFFLDGRKNLFSSTVGNVCNMSIWLLLS